MSEPAWESARQQLIRLLREHAVQYGPATVARGTVTGVFVEASRVTLLSRGLSVIEALLVPLLAHDHVDAIGGPARRHRPWEVTGHAATPVGTEAEVRWKETESPH
jgi:hypothetical protein